MIVDLFLVYQFVRRLATPFNEWDAYKLGIIDERGNVLRKRKTLKLAKERKAFGIFDVLVLNLKKLIEKVPGGQTRIASYIAALYLIREWNHFSDGSLLTEDITDEQLDESIELFFSRYYYYNTLPENVNQKMSLDEVKDKHPVWKRAGRAGEIEIKFPTGRRFKVAKHYVDLPRGGIGHKGEWQVLEYKSGYVDDWELIDVYSPKAYAQHRAMIMGQYDKQGKKVADYSSKFKYESVQEDAPAVNVGGGNIAGLGVGPQGEPGLTPSQMKRYKKKNTGPKRLRDIIGAKI